MAAGAIHGRLGRVRIGASVATTSTNVAATLSSADKKTLTIANTSQRHWLDPSTLPRLYGATTDTELADAYTVDRVRGRITFSTAHSTSVAYKVDIAWLPTSCLGLTRSWTLDVSNNLVDATVFSCSTTEANFREFVPGHSEATVQLGRLVASSESTAPPFVDRQALAANVYVELMQNATAGDKLEMLAHVQSDAHSRSVDNLAEETISLRVDGPVYLTTST